MTDRALRILITLSVVFIIPAIAQKGWAADLENTVRAARTYLQTEDPKEKARIAKNDLAKFDGDWAEVIAAFRAEEYPTVAPGYYPGEHFSDPELQKKHPDDLLFIQVPSAYDPAQPAGLIVFMHGGGSDSPRTAPDRYMLAADAGTSKRSTRLGDVFETAGMIGVGPSAPWNEKDSSRWCLPEADDYLADVIRECKQRFHIDDDRVFLMGHSMGGFGAWHQVQRQPDRFAAVIGSAGMWSFAHWPAIRGTTFCIVHGARDAERGVRDRHTDIAYARWGHRLLEQHGIPHVFKEHPDGHSFGYGKSKVLEFLKASRDLRRDPAFPHVVLVSPVGYKSSRSFPARHNRWVTLEAAREGTVEYDALQREGPGHRKDSSVEDWSQWRLVHETVKRNGARIEAINEGNNRFRVTTLNVAGFTLWLNEAMVDFDADIQVMVDGKVLFAGRLKPSLTTLLDSYRRRGDWGLVYPAKVTIDLKEWSRKLGK